MVNRLKDDEILKKTSAEFTDSEGTNLSVHWNNEYKYFVISITDSVGKCTNSIDVNYKDLQSLFEESKKLMIQLDKGWIIQLRDDDEGERFYSSRGRNIAYEKAKAKVFKSKIDAEKVMEQCTLWPKRRLISLKGT